MNLNDEYPLYAAASATGIRVFAADLIDLGTPGQHTYVNHTEEGQAVLDAARAGLEFVGTAVDNHMIAGVAGYALNGALARHPELADLQDEYFNEKGHEFMSATADECIGNSVEN